MIRSLLLAALTAPALHAQSSPARAPAPSSPSGSTVFVDVAVVPMDRERVLPHQTVVVQDGRILALGPVHRTAIPADAVSIDGRGQYLLPGLSDCHTHLTLIHVYPETPWTPWPADLPPDIIIETLLFRWLASGVTTIRNVDFGDKGIEDRADHKQWLLTRAEVLQLRARAASGTIWSPRIYTAGQWGPRRYTQSGFSGNPAPPLDSVAGYVADYKAAGYDILKVHDESPEVALAVLAAARRVKLPVVGHVKGTLEQALGGGMQTIEHLTGYPQPPRAGRNPDTTTTAYAKYKEAYVAYQAMVAPLAAATRRAGTWNCVALGDNPALIHALQDSGAGLLLGTDDTELRGEHPITIDFELQRLVRRERLTPYEVLTTGTTSFAKYVKLLDPKSAATGTVAVGAPADLVLLRGNPLEDIKNVERPTGVMRAGRWLARAELDRRLDSLTRQEHYWRLVAERENLVASLESHDTGRGEAPRRVLDSLKSVHRAQAIALLPALQPAADDTSGARRLVDLLARQLGDVRIALSPDDQSRFDAVVRGWLTRREAEGCHPVIPGVSP